ncbi:uncharacterized protein LOC112554196 isoform X2 [Pomacea canaliculata]|uniref:uncharacterized protein LOC112554196 isoform X2 n=1 Tax=Pomacea canaliculata TaxID=400727 RepID=UPI000D72F357|nr:uncharacterized protein LOC112554196 isoform X2 [Pomacea canaliculata]XP_025077629.1 uncharacterized protein LOC112554196 isoform X2 [Pomacea canaliculata]
MWPLWALYITFLCCWVTAQQNLLLNPGFESPLDGHWEAEGFTFSLTNDAHSGEYAFKSSGRTAAWQGPTQQVMLQRGRAYTLTAWVKQLNDKPGKVFQVYRAAVVLRYSDASTTDRLFVIDHSMVRAADGWFQMTGYFRTPDRALSSAQVHFQVQEPGVDFLMDDTSLQELVDDVRWKEAADRRIQELRTGNIHMQFTLPRGVLAQDVNVEVSLKKHEFGFGTLIQDSWLTDSVHTKYQEQVFKLFNTATTQGVKWKFDRGTQFHPDFSRAVHSINLLREKGIRVRAHNMFWGFEKNLPDYVKTMSASTLNTTVHERLVYMTNLIKGKAEHWDVVNELLHGQWFEDRMGDPLYSEHLYREVHNLDPYPQLFLNDYSVAARAEATDAYLQLARKFLAHGVPVHGLGVQSHFHTAVPDPTLIMAILDHLAQAGLPIWATELDVWQEDRAKRADYYDTVLRLFFSHPAVKGVIFWGFWDQDVVDSRSALAEGSNVELNEAGHRFVDLTQREWSTNVSVNLASNTFFNITGFKGEYEAKVMYHNSLIKVIPFTLSNERISISVDIEESLVG